MPSFIEETQKATRAHTKAHNQRLILKTIYDHGAISRADVSRVTHLTRTTVSSAVAQIMNNGLVEEVGTREKSVGKPATLLSVAKNGYHMICLDLASSVFRGCVLNLGGEILHEEALALDGRRGDEAINLAFQLADLLKEKVGAPLLGIGVGAPGVVDPEFGDIHSAVNLDWSHLPLRRLLEQRYGAPIYLSNDSHMAALGQYVFGMQGKVRNLIVLKAGYGISAGIMLGGKLLYGDGFGTGEIGHVVIRNGGALCTCGNSGCLEAMAGTRALCQQVCTIAASSQASQLHEFVMNNGVLDTDIILEAFQKGDQTLVPAIERSGRYLGMAIANLIGALNIRHVLVAGSLSRFGDVFINAIRAEVKSRTLAGLFAETHIEAASLGENIVTLGAGAMVMSRELGIV